MKSAAAGTFEIGTPFIQGETIPCPSAPDIPFRSRLTPTGMQHVKIAVPNGV
jgi:hypothetical protein